MTGATAAVGQQSPTSGAVVAESVWFQFVLSLAGPCAATTRPAVALSDAVFALLSESAAMLMNSHGASAAAGSAVFGVVEEAIESGEGGAEWSSEVDRQQPQKSSTIITAYRF